MNRIVHWKLWGWIASVLLVSLAACRANTLQETPFPTAGTLDEQTHATITPIPTQKSGQTALTFTDFNDNRGDYPEYLVPRAGKYEASFQVLNSVATNFQFPYDPDPPNGIDLAYAPHNGINVDALFTPDNWQTVYRQPAFYYQYFEDQVHIGEGGKERPWRYPTERFAWRVRFAPHLTGEWQYKLVAQDASGMVESPVYAFEVGDSDRKGFIQISLADPRYFEYGDGSSFAGLGFNRGANLDDLLLEKEAEFQTYQANGIQLLRVWITDIYGSSWNPYVGGRNIYDGYIPRTGLAPFFDSGRGRETISMRLDYEPEGDTGWFDACRLRWGENLEAVKPDTNYLIQVKYRGLDISGPRDSSYPDFGLVAKLGGWFPDCYQPGTSTPVTDYGLNNDDWGYIQGEWNSGENYFLPRLHLGLENVNQGQVYIDHVSVREVLGNGQFGPEILVRPSMEHHLYVPQEQAYALDQLIELAEVYGITLKLVILEKGEQIFYRIGDDGEFLEDEQPDNQDGFYGVWRQVNKTRWLQAAWWRYLQARWGYSANIHSWELTNEGDPFYGSHYAQTDELGKYMHCRAFGVDPGSGDGQECSYDHPNAHLVTTSFWHSMPREQFWANPSYPNVDYADVHAYISSGWIGDPAHENDAALYHLQYSAQARRSLDRFSEEANLATKPIVRGEAGLDFVDNQIQNPDLGLDLNGVWLHNFLWSTLDPGGMYELYWWGDNLENQPGPDGEPGLYEVYGYLYDFVQNIPLNNGYYQDAQAEASDPKMRVTGQKDLANQRAHLWVQNRQHTWRNVVDEAEDISGLAGTLILGGFNPNTPLPVEWHEFTTQGLPVIRSNTVVTDGDGNIVLELPGDMQITDVGIKIGTY